jgi:5-methylcytosine-specific restriction endonuclease McrA
MLRPKRLPRCERRSLPRRLKAEIILRQDGRCADCSTRLIMGFFVFDHRPPLALRAEDADANDPERLAAICWTCDQQKTPRDLKEIARNNRIARKHQEFVQRQREKKPGRRLPTPSQWRELERFVGQPLATKVANSDKDQAAVAGNAGDPTPAQERH